MSTIRVAVGEMDPKLLPGTESWENLISDLGRAQPDLFVLSNEPNASRQTYNRHPSG